MRMLLSACTAVSLSKALPCSSFSPVRELRLTSARMARVAMSTAASVSTVICQEIRARRVTKTSVVQALTTMSRKSMTA